MERNVVERAVNTEIDYKKRIKEEDQLGWFISEDITLTSPPHEGETREDNKGNLLFESKGVIMAESFEVVKISPLAACRAQKEERARARVCLCVCVTQVGQPCFREKPAASGIR